MIKKTTLTDSKVSSQVARPAQLGDSIMGFSKTFQGEPPTRHSALVALIKQGDLVRLHQFLRKDEQFTLDSHQKSLLFYACHYNQPAILLYLLLLGVPIGQTDAEQRNLFHVCAYVGGLGCLDVILQRLSYLRKIEAQNNLRRLHVDYDIKKADYKSGELHEPSSMNKQERFRMFHEGATKVLEQYLQVELDDYVTALSLQNTVGRHTPIHLGSLNRYQRCYQTLKRMIRQEEDNAESFREYVRLWSEISNLLRQQFPDPRFTNEVERELENAVGRCCDQIKSRFRAQFEKELVRIMCLQDKNNQTALHLASQNGHANIVGLLLKVGGSADRSTSSTTSPQNIIQCAANDPTRRQITDLCKASGAGDKKSMSLLINCGEEVNHKQTIYGLTPLIESVVFSGDKGTLQSVSLLLDNGADTDIQDVNGWTSLHRACEKGNLELVQLLLSRKANAVQASNKGYTPLHIASLNNHPKVVEELLKLKVVDVNCRDEQGCTPLHLAAKKGANEAIEQLLNHAQCNLYSVDKKKWSALHYATFSERNATISLLLKYDADKDQLRYLQNCQGKLPKELSNSSGIRNAYSTVWKAASEGKLDDMRKLLLNGDDKDASTIRLKRTPLMLAVLNCHPLMVKFLLDQGADTYSEDCNGKSAEAHARDCLSNATDKIRKQQFERILKLLSS